MFKRSTKITSLLVAAASVISMVPAMAADVKKVDNETGKLYHAFAYKDGKFYVDGEVKDKDEATYYVDGKDYKELSEVDTNSDVKAFGEGYIDISSGDYTLDLSNGKVKDDNDREDNADEAKTALKKKIKKDDSGRVTDKDKEALFLGYTDNGYLPGNKFGETWYGFEYTLKNGKGDDHDRGIEKIQVYSNKDGKYIDADYNLGKIKVKTTASDKVINVENTKQAYDISDIKDNAVYASFVGTPEVVAQDKDYFYRIATIKITAEGTEIEEINGKNTSKFNEKVIKGKKTVDDMALKSDGDSVTFKVVQKISKAQSSDDVNGLKYAKSVSNYVISNDSAEAKNLFKDVEDVEPHYSVANGKLISYSVFKDDDDDIKVKAYASTLKSKDGFYYTDISDGADVKVEHETTDLSKVDSVDTDVDGNLWALSDGNIKKFNNDDGFDKVYKVDGSMRHLSVYDKDNMVVYSDQDDDDNVYALIGGKSEEEKPAVTEQPTVTAGWNQAADGTYTYINADGTKKTGWFFDPAYNHYYYLDPATGVMKANTWFFDPAYGKYYYLDGSGAMMANTWFFDPAYGHYYYFDGSGAMQTGWFYDGYNWYYADASGAMLANTTVDGYVLGASGAWIQ